MRIVVALGGNALLKRGEPLTSENQRANIKLATAALAPLAKAHELVITHGNGPQVGLLALQGAAYKPDEAYPLDVLGAETEGMIGYMIEQEMRNELGGEKPLATLLTMIEVDKNDSAFADPTKFVGPVYDEADAKRFAAQKGWSIKPDGDKWRKVVPSPKPKSIYEIEPIRRLLESGTVVTCAGGGGIPVCVSASGDIEGVEAVIDKDFASALLAKEIDADLFIMATDAEAVFLDWGEATQHALAKATPAQLRQYDFAAGSMGPKVQAACEFVEATGGKAAIGALSDLADIIAGSAGTTVVSSA